MLQAVPFSGESLSQASSQMQLRLMVTLMPSGNGPSPCTSRLSAQINLWKIYRTGVSTVAGSVTHPLSYKNVSFLVQLLLRIIKIVVFWQIIPLLVDQCNKRREERACRLQSTEVIASTIKAAIWDLIQTEKQIDKDILLSVNLTYSIKVLL